MKSKTVNKNHSKQQKWGTYGLNVITRKQCEDILKSLRNFTDIKGYKRHIIIGCNEISKIVTKVDNNNGNNSNNSNNNINAISAIIMVKSCPEAMVKHLLDAISLKKKKIPIIILPNDSVKYLSQLLNIKRVSCFCIKRFNDDDTTTATTIDHHTKKREIEKHMDNEYYPSRVGLTRNKLISLKRMRLDTNLKIKDDTGHDENDRIITPKLTFISGKTKINNDIGTTNTNSMKNAEEINKNSESELIARLDGLEELLNELFKTMKSGNCF